MDKYSIRFYGLGWGVCIDNYILAGPFATHGKARYWMRKRLPQLRFN